jgi:hypothetical protein
LPTFERPRRARLFANLTLDGEAVLDVDGISDFNALHFGKRNDEVQPCAFDILAGGGDATPSPAAAGAGFEAAALSGRSIEALAEDEEPQSPSDNRQIW